MRTKFFIDTEFIESCGSLEPISIGIVREDGRAYYAVVGDFPAHKASEWVRKHVIEQLPPSSAWKDRATIAAELRAFVGSDDPEFWGYYSDYDWVLFCWLMGGSMLDIPKGWPMFCLDLKQSMHERNIVDRPPSPTNAHDALADAHWTRELYRHVFGT